ncbi:MAG: glycosyltransferase [Burkholderiales bacterium]|nr:glycosyltransferase [Burkholderiales bacterium]
MRPVPRVSIVIPAYNHERFIAQALASLQAQTVDDFEVVVVDDGSTDGTAALAHAAAQTDPRIRVVEQANAGSHGAINRGIGLARARWIAILNSDDCFAPTRLQRLLDAAQAGARFVVTDTRLIDDAGDEITDPTHWWHRTLDGFLAQVDAHGPIEGLMHGNFTVSTSNFFFERSLVDEIGPFRPLRRVIDWDWALRAALHAPAGFRHLRGERLLDYRLHGRNAILGDPLPGMLEIGRVHRTVLLGLGVPRTLLASLQRNRRELRRAWRDREVARVEAFVRQRQAQVEALQEELGLASGHVDRLVLEAQTRVAEIDRLNQRLQASAAQLIEQTAQLAAQRDQIGARDARIEAQATTLTELTSENAAQAATLAILRARLDRIEGSLPWRVLGALKRLARPRAH